MAVEHTLNRLRLDGKFMKNVAAWQRMPARPARTAEFPQGLNPVLVGALRQRGLAPLYTHQARAVQSALAGENVVVVTGTASGKTMCYNLPVLNTLLAKSGATALYLFPTKALAQDQAAELGEFAKVLGGESKNLRIRTYDGDTPQGRRAAIRTEANILITNPDMLHMGILPHHTRWAEFFENLHYVVLDELHTYTGVFGSHMANVLRRLRRLCRFYGADPQFVLTSATIANSKELAEKLIEAPVTVIPPEEDGAPRAEKVFILYNPPVIDPALGVRRAYTLESKDIAAQFLRDEVQTVLFARARLTTEVLLGYLRDEVERRGNDPNAVRGYRGGYLPLERREIEKGLRDGSVRGVVATNALELGVDIGQLGAAIIAGYPGSIASVWQQAGRAGRRSEVSAAVLVASGAPLDQYIALHPRYLFESSPEHGLINPDNLAILVNHLRCAAFELPFEKGQGFGSYEDAAGILDVLVEAGELHFSSGDYRWVSETYPADGVSLRRGSDDTVVIQNITEGRPEVIGEIDRQTAPVFVHEGAVYLHEGRQFLVEQLDWENALALVKAVDLDYYTSASEAAELDVTRVEDADESRPMRRAWGSVLVRSRATSFRKVKRYTHETLGYGEIDLPERSFETTGYWLWVSEDAVEQLQLDGILLKENDYGPNWPAMRDAARARDGYRCQQCRAAEREGRRHHVHHMKPFREFGYLAGQNENYRQANELGNLLTLCPACHGRIENQLGARSALGGLAYALGNLAPLYLMCDPRDISFLTESRSRETGAPTITIYDRMPDGLGFAARLYELHAELLRGAFTLVSSCPCREGCPACVGPVMSQGSEVKALTLKLVQTLISSEK